MGTEKRNCGCDRISENCRALETKAGDCCSGCPQSRNGSSTRQRPDGDRRSDDGKPRDKVSDTMRNMAAGEPC